MSKDGGLDVNEPIRMVCGNCGTDHGGACVTLRGVISEATRREGK